DGSASIAVIGRGQRAPINKAVVVTPGEPLTDATVSMAISQPPQVSLTAGLSPPMSAGVIDLSSIACETADKHDTSIDTTRDIESSPAPVTSPSSSSPTDTSSAATDSRPESADDPTDTAIWAPGCRVLMNGLESVGTVSCVFPSAIPAFDETISAVRTVPGSKRVAAAFPTMSSTWSDAMPPEKSSGKLTFDTSESLIVAPCATS